MMQASHPFFNNFVKGIACFSYEMSGLLEDYTEGDVFLNKHLSIPQHHFSLIAMLLANRAEDDWLTACFKDASLDACTFEELQEVCIQLSAYIGFPAVVRGLKLLDIAMKELSPSATSPGNSYERVKNRYDKGVAELEALEPGRTALLQHDYQSFAPDYVRTTLEFGYGDLYARPFLDKPTKQAIRVAAIAALGYASVPLQFHMNAGLTVGLNKAQQVEILLMLTAITGFPAAMNAMNVLKNL
jgi:4-carboxymuconolactone decarboxylase